MKVILLLTIGLISLSAGSQLTCNFKKENWNKIYFDKNYQTCVIENKAIFSPDSTIAPFSKDAAEAIMMRYNKNVMFLPLNLAKFPDLLAIDFSSCGISSIGNQLKGLRLMVFLRLASNQIDDIQSDAFEDLVKLEWLGLNENKLTHVKGELFKTLSSLETLFLHKNQIESIEPLAFVHLISLKLLYLTDNKLTFIDAKTFQGLIKLKKLYLYKNEIDAIELQTFDALQNLNLVSLHTNVCIDKIFDSSTLRAIQRDLEPKCAKNFILKKFKKTNGNTNANSKIKVDNEILVNLKETLENCKTENENFRSEIRKIKSEKESSISEKFSEALKAEDVKFKDLKQHCEIETSNLKKQVEELQDKLKEFLDKYDKCRKNKG